MISAPGLGSGLDVNGIVSQLMAIEQRPLLQLGTKEAKQQAELSAYGNLKSGLSTFQGTVKTLANPTLFTGVKASIVDSTIASVSAKSNAEIGAHTIEVQTLAQAQKIKSESFTSPSDTIGSGTLTIEFGTYNGDGTFTENLKKASKSITIEPGQSSLSDIRDTINKANIGVSASIVNDGNGNRLVLASNDSGLSNSLKITVNDADSNNIDNSGLSKLAYDASTGGTANMSETVAARNATMVIDGITITKPSNTITDALQGITFNLFKTNAGTTTSLSVTKDTTSVQTAVSTFVNAYNELQKTISSLSNYDAANKQASVLTGDSTLRSVQTQLRNVLNSNLQSGAVGGLNTLSQAGISFQKNGTLQLDSGKLNAALNDPAMDISSLFATDGFAVKLNQVIDGMLKNDGLIDGRMDGINVSIKDIGKQREALGSRLEIVEKRFRAQFTALDSTIAGMKRTSEFLTQQLSNLPGANSGN